MENTFIISKIENLAVPAKELTDKMAGRPVWAFFGEMGAGKTTFIKEICSQLNVKDAVGSPTFNLINEYETSRGELVYHFDFYRINTLDEALEIGTPDYFDSGNLCLIEWPEKIAQLLPENYIRIEIIAEENGNRTIKVKNYE